MRGRRNRAGWHLSEYAVVVGVVAAAVTLAQGPVTNYLVAGYRTVSEAMLGSGRPAGTNWSTSLTTVREAHDASVLNTDLTGVASGGAASGHIITETPGPALLQTLSGEDVNSSTAQMFEQFYKDYKKNKRDQRRRQLERQLEDGEISVAEYQEGLDSLDQEASEDEGFRLSGGTLDALMEGEDAVVTANSEEDTPLEAAWKEFSAATKEVFWSLYTDGEGNEHLVLAALVDTNGDGKLDGADSLYIALPQELLQEQAGLMNREATEQFLTERREVAEKLKAGLEGVLQDAQTGATSIEESLEEAAYRLQPEERQALEQLLQETNKQLESPDLSAEDRTALETQKSQIEEQLRLDGTGAIDPKKMSAETEKVLKERAAQLRAILAGANGEGEAYLAGLTEGDMGGMTREELARYVEQGKSLAAGIAQAGAVLDAVPQDLSGMSPEQLVDLAKQMDATVAGLQAGNEAGQQYDADSREFSLAVQLPDLQQAGNIMETAFLSDEEDTSFGPTFSVSMTPTDFNQDGQAEYQEGPVSDWVMGYLALKELSNNITQAKNEGKLTEEEATQMLGQATELMQEFTAQLEARGISPRAMKDGVLIDTEQENMKAGNFDDVGFYTMEGWSDEAGLSSRDNNELNLWATDASPQGFASQLEDLTKQLARETDGASVAEGSWADWFLAPQRDSLNFTNLVGQSTQEVVEGAEGYAANGNLSPETSSSLTQEAQQIRGQLEAKAEAMGGTLTFLSDGSVVVEGLSLGEQRELDTLAKSLGGDTVGLRDRMVAAAGTDEWSMMLRDKGVMVTAEGVDTPQEAQQRAFSEDLGTWVGPDGRTYYQIPGASYYLGDDGKVYFVDDADRDSTLLTSHSAQQDISADFNSTASLESALNPSSGTGLSFVNMVFAATSEIQDKAATQNTPEAISGTTWTPLSDETRAAIDSGAVDIRGAIVAKAEELGGTVTTNADGTVSVSGLSPQEMVQLDGFAQSMTPQVDGLAKQLVSGIVEDGTQSALKIDSGEAYDLDNPDGAQHSVNAPAGTTPDEFVDMLVENGMAVRASPGCTTQTCYYQADNGLLYPTSATIQEVDRGMAQGRSDEVAQSMTATGQLMAAASSAPGVGTGGVMQEYEVVSQTAGYFNQTAQSLLPEGTDVSQLSTEAQGGAGEVRTGQAVATRVLDGMRQILRDNGYTAEQAELVLAGRDPGVALPASVVQQLNRYARQNAESLETAGDHIETGMTALLSSGPAAAVESAPGAAGDDPAEQQGGLPSAATVLKDFNARTGGSEAGVMTSTVPLVEVDGDGMPDGYVAVTGHNPPDKSQLMGPGNEFQAYDVRPMAWIQVEQGSEGVQQILENRVDMAPQIQSAAEDIPENYAMLAGFHGGKDSRLENVAGVLIFDPQGPPPGPRTEARPEGSAQPAGTSVQKVHVNPYNGEVTAVWSDNTRTRYESVAQFKQATGASAPQASGPTLSSTVTVWGVRGPEGAEVVEFRDDATGQVHQMPIAEFRSMTHSPEPAAGAQTADPVTAGATLHVQGTPDVSIPITAGGPDPVFNLAPNGSWRPTGYFYQDGEVSPYQTSYVGTTMEVRPGQIVINPETKEVGVIGNNGQVREKYASVADFQRATGAGVHDGLNGLLVTAGADTSTFNPAADVPDAAVNLWATAGSGAANPQVLTVSTVQGGRVAYVDAQGRTVTTSVQEFRDETGFQGTITPNMTVTVDPTSSLVGGRGEQNVIVQSVRGGQVTYLDAEGLTHTMPVREFQQQTGLTGVPAVAADVAVDPVSNIPRGPDSSMVKVLGVQGGRVTYQDTSGEVHTAPLQTFQDHTETTGAPVVGSNIVIDPTSVLLVGEHVTIQSVRGGQVTFVDASGQTLTAPVQTFLNETGLPAAPSPRDDVLISPTSPLLNPTPAGADSGEPLGGGQPQHQVFIPIATATATPDVAAPAVVHAPDAEPSGLELQMPTTSTTPTISATGVYNDTLKINVPTGASSVSLADVPDVVVNVPTSTAGSPRVVTGVDRNPVTGQVRISYSDGSGDQFRSMGEFQQRTGMTALPASGDTVPFTALAPATNLNASGLNAPDVLMSGTPGVQISSTAPEANVSGFTGPVATGLNSAGVGNWRMTASVVPTVPRATGGAQTIELNSSMPAGTVLTQQDARGQTQYAVVDSSGTRAVVYPSVSSMYNATGYAAPGTNVGPSDSPLATHGPYVAVLDLGNSPGVGNWQATNGTVPRVPTPHSGVGRVELNSSMPAGTVLVQQGPTGQAQYAVVDTTGQSAVVYYTAGTLYQATGYTVPNVSVSSPDPLMPSSSLTPLAPTISSTGVHNDTLTTTTPTVVGPATIVLRLDGGQAIWNWAPTTRTIPMSQVPASASDPAGKVDGATPGQILVNPNTRQVGIVSRDGTVVLYRDVNQMQSATGYNVQGGFQGLVSSIPAATPDTLSPNANVNVLSVDIPTTMPSGAPVRTPTPIAQTPTATLRVINVSGNQITFREGGGAPRTMSLSAFQRTYNVTERPTPNSNIVVNAALDAPDTVNISLPRDTSSRVINPNAPMPTELEATLPIVAPPVAASTNPALQPVGTDWDVRGVRAE